MATNVSRLAERRWRRMRSEHARTLEGIEAAMALHPSRGVSAEPLRLRVVTVTPRDDDAA